jgi:hypothetical protein
MSILRAVSQRLDRVQIKGGSGVGTNTATFRWANNRRSAAKDRRQTLFHLVKPRANSRSALGPTAAKGGCTANRQFASVACLSCRRNAQQLCYLDTAAFRTMWRVSLTADQGLECMVTRLTLILINRHRRSDSSIAEAGALVSSSQTPSPR